MRVSRDQGEPVSPESKIFYVFFLYVLGKVNAHYFAKEDFTTNSSKCICIRKGEVGQLLEVQSSGWWKMCVEGVVGWTPGEFWDMLQVRPFFNHVHLVLACVASVSARVRRERRDESKKKRTPFCFSLPL